MRLTRSLEAEQFHQATSSTTPNFRLQSDPAAMPARTRAGPRESPTGIDTMRGASSPSFNSLQADELAMTAVITSGS